MVTRKCPICSSKESEKVYRQHFSGLSEGGLFDGYDVVVCSECGFGFADDIPDQSVFDEYYKQMSKYEKEYMGGQVSESTLSTYREIVKTVSTVLTDKQARILDVGCATGALLAEFKKSGYQNVTGLDPSSSCASTAQKLYGIRVLNCAVSELSEFETAFDFLILNDVLEHIRNLNSSLQLMRGLLKPNGMIWIEVPDVSLFSQYISAAFQQFSVEHINFFSPTSLANLIQQNGFETVGIWQNARQVETIIDPALSAIFKITEKKPAKLTVDRKTKSSMLEYIEKSFQVDSGILQKIEAIVASGKEIIVWGVGTHTQRLLATSHLGKAKIRAFVDSNARYQGKQLNNVPILPPEKIKGMHETIMISSCMYQEEIAGQIRNDFGLPNEISRLYEAG
ncbi:MAG TPA: methyltransferase domain-containing protein [Nitrospirae bacterium]|nr:methyltransferase domain-containing protein [Nitrospirota bacterium]